MVESRGLSRWFEHQRADCAATCDIRSGAQDGERVARGDDDQAIDVSPKFGDTGRIQPSAALLAAAFADPDHRVAIGATYAQQQREACCSRAVIRLGGIEFM